MLPIDYAREIVYNKDAIKEASDLFATQPPRDVEQKSEYDHMAIKENENTIEEFLSYKLSAE